MGIRLALCQTKASKGEVGLNLNKIMSVISQTKSDVYVFPELFLTGYGADYSSLENNVQCAIDKIRLWCMEKDIAVVVGSPSYDPDGLKNSLLFIAPDSITRYDKLYPARFGIYNENEFVSGKCPKLAVFKDITFGLSICYDIFFPEIYRNYALSSANVNLCIAASATPSRSYYDRMLPARSLENVIYTIFVNNIGDLDGENTFYGHSRLVGPFGNIINELEDKEEVLCVYLDKEVLKNARNERRHLDDLRNDIEWIPKGC